jgi:hypothetical protein
MNTENPLAGRWITTPCARALLFDLSPRRARNVWAALAHEEREGLRDLVTRYLDLAVAARMLQARMYRGAPNASADAARLISQRVIMSLKAYRETLVEYGYFDGPCGHSIDNYCASPWSNREWCAYCAERDAE